MSWSPNEQQVDREDGPGPNNALASTILEPEIAEFQSDLSSEVPPTVPEAFVISDTELNEADDDLHIQRVHRLTTQEIRKRKIDAARAALRRAATRTPRRPARKNPLLSTYKCSVCLCPPRNICVTPCGHLFCGACLYDALAMQMRQDGHEWSETDWLGVMGDPTAGRQTREQNLFTPFGSGGALALANAAGVSSSPAREIFSELVLQRQARQQETDHTDNSSVPSNRLRQNNGTGKLRGHCPVCRSIIPGGFTGVSRRGALGLEIMVGTPAPTPAIKHGSSQGDDNQEAES
ncbi:RING-type E3 ubiquitin transferase [Malassezia yamatoensis]|uniref:RING-type E3 ubiquitin transferase n=1 Tax=Malassezia yamatoensis TaxID=253288 RepID=A0AAJ6CGU4_9BASI|nr:RING-type E3 ubiquitin transferase [Malassezia yamatoensis]